MVKYDVLLTNFKLVNVLLKAITEQTVIGFVRLYTAQIRSGITF